MRSELAELEEQGLLTHPHTSAGRIPTDGGYRHYVDSLLSERAPQVERLQIDLSTAQNEVEEALETTTEMLSEMTHLLALASAPSLETTAVRHVEVLQLQPQIVLVVLITSAGRGLEAGLRVFGVGRRGAGELGARVPERAPRGADAGAAARAPGARGSRADRQRARLSSPSCARPSRSRSGRGEERVFVGGAATLLDAVRGSELDACRSLLSVLERRAATLELLRASIEQRRPYVRVGEELENPALSGVSLVGARYGLAHRSLGTVSLLGPIRMDYEKAIAAVRAAAQELSRFVEDVYEEP